MLIGVAFRNLEKQLDNNITVTQTLLYTMISLNFCNKVMEYINGVPQKPSSSKPHSAQERKGRLMIQYTSRIRIYNDMV